MERLKNLDYKQEAVKLSGNIFGAVLYAIGINIFTAPCNLYTGGLMGICQLIRTALSTFLQISPANIDLAGIIYYLINIPIMILAYKKLGRMFLARTVVCVTTVTLAMSLIPIPAIPIMEDDILAACIIGGAISGCGVGICLRMGGCAGGMDIIGILLIKWKKNFSVGKVNFMVNVILYGTCLFLFDMRIVVYSLVFAAITSFSTDKVHAQNINVEVTIITKKKSPEMEAEVFAQLGRGITKWQTQGAYTHEDSEILYVLLSKYEVNQLKQIIHTYDPQAFIVVNEGVNVDGNYVRKV